MGRGFVPSPFLLETHMNIHPRLLPPPRPELKPEMVLCHVRRREPFIGRRNDIDAMPYVDFHKDFGLYLGDTDGKWYVALKDFFTLGELLEYNTFEELKAIWEVD